MGHTPQHSNLWRGYPEYESRRGTLVANTVATETFTDGVVSILVEHGGAVTNDIYVTFDGTTPDPAGASDTGKKMVRIKQGESKSFDLACTTVKLVSAGAADYQIIGLR